MVARIENRWLFGARAPHAHVFRPENENEAAPSFARFSRRVGFHEPLPLGFPGTTEWRDKN
jgi:hypothetical protein